MPLIIKTARATILYVKPDRVVVSGGPVVPGLPFEIGGPHFTFGPPVAAYIQYCILKMSPLLFFAPPSGFWAPLLLNLGDGPATRYEISQPSRPISPRAATANASVACVAVTLARPLHVSKVGQSKEKGKAKQATLISDFHADGSRSFLWPIRLVRS